MTGFTVLLTLVPIRVISLIKFDSVANLLNLDKCVVTGLNYSRSQLDILVFLNALPSLQFGKPSFVMVRNCFVRLF